MTSIKIQYPAGDVEVRQLEKSQPISIGRHSSNDVCIDEEAVAVLHCRISWNKSGFEVTAATTEGVELNGKFVRNSALSSGDVLRVGSADISVQDKNGKSAPTIKPASEVELAPISEEQPIYFSRGPAEMGESRPAETSRPQERKPASRRQEPVSDDQPDDVINEGWLETDAPDSIDDLFADDPVEDPPESDDAAERLAPGKEQSKPASPAKLPRHSTAPRSRERSRPRFDPNASLLSRVKGLFSAPPTRPGEQDILRSPMLISLAGGALILLLVAATFWFIIGRETVQRQYDAAMDELNQGNYSQAIRRFEEFLEKNARHKLAVDARINLGKTQIDRQISGSTPSWQQGLAALQQFIEQQRDSDEFQDLQAEIREYAETIAIGSVKSAALARTPALLETAVDARKLVERYSPSDEPPTEFLRKFVQEYRKSEAAILKNDTVNTALMEMETALKNGQPVAAFAARRQLLLRYPDLEKDRKVRAALQQALDRAKELVIVEEIDRAAITQERSPAFGKSLTLTLHVRARTSEKPDGRTVFSVAKGSCFAVDAVSGDPIWKRPIGLDSPFFPIEVATSIPGVLLFDARHRELMLVHRRTGDIAWRQPLDESISGSPLVLEGQVYLPTSAGNLYKIDVEKGRITTKLSFSQGLHSPPVALSGGQYIAVAGREDVLYVLSLRPFQCVTVSHVDHQTQSVEAPLVAMGRMLLLCENDRDDSCRLRVIDAREPESRLPVIDEVRIAGLVRNTPVLRGKQLFVPSTIEQVTAFSVSDDPGQKPLALIASFPAETDYSGNLYLSSGPDGQVWMAGSAVRRLNLIGDAFKLDPTTAAPGLSAQPLQTIGDRMFAGRQTPYAGAVTFTQIDRTEMVGLWKTVVGSTIQSYYPVGDSQVRCITEMGEVFVLELGQLQTGGFEYRPETELELSPQMSAPLRISQLSGDRAAVSCGAPEPKFWIVNKGGRVENTIDLEAPLQCAPVELGDKLVLPLPGKLKLVDPRTARPVAEEYLAAIGGGEARTWRQLATLDSSNLIATNDEGLMLRLQLRTEPVAHLAETAKLAMPAPLHTPFLVVGDDLILTDGQAHLRIVDPSDFRTIAETVLEKPALAGPWLVDGRVYVQSGRDKLECFEIQPELKRVWSLPLADQSLAGPPLLVEQQLILGLHDGTIVVVNADDGREIIRKSLNQPVNLGPARLGSAVIVPTIDGALWQIEPILKEAG